MKYDRQKTKAVLALALSLSVGFASGFMTKEICDKGSAAHAGSTPAAPVPVKKVDDQEIAKSNHLIAPHIWDIYLDPLFVPVDFVAKPLSLVPLISFPETVPKVQTVDGDKELRVVAQVPGMTEKDVNVQASEHAVTIKAHKIREEKNKTLFESVDESFQQTVHLPCKVNADKVQATVKDGVLTVVLPKESG